MRLFTTGELNKQDGHVTDAACPEPVVVTKHRKPRFVLMSWVTTSACAPAAIAGKYIVRRKRRGSCRSVCGGNRSSGAWRGLKR
jgi:hypothetical protein